MEIHQFDKLTKPITPEQIRKTDVDIATIDALNKYAENNHTILVLSGGYATEALCGGKITRPHGDIDLHMPIPENQDVAEVFLEIGKIIIKEQTKWSLRKQTDKKVEFIEEDGDIDFFDKRRLELTVHKEEEKPVFTPANLINSTDKMVNVLTINVNELIASKIHSIYRSKNDVNSKMGRNTNKNDINDIKRLLKLPSYSKEVVLELLTSRYVKNEGISDVKSIAVDEFSQMESLIQ